ncbi:protein adenylyltransferase SelO [Lunatibacter salilacus]|uniref:protein adenylyltransferase SelO n=1 Tax=Lunatibacter salilacus TaxID=2483804 RepID=UPI00131DCE0E|nr:YdiU family protein [Lunatibacter salilacus]
MSNPHTLGSGWNLKHTYTSLPEKFYSLKAPVPVKEPKIVLLNKQLAKDLGLNFEGVDENHLAKLFAGNLLPEDSQPFAQAYAGHQFGNFTMLGDGRAIMLGEQMTPDGEMKDIQFKGSGRTVFSRGGDGRSTLKAMLREYLISEAMHGLGIPSTRSLAVVTTGEPVYREQVQAGSILTRVAESHIRVGTFEFSRQYLSEEELKELLNYTIARHYPACMNSENPTLEFFNAVMNRQAALIAEWVRVGFIHGVMNTDNMSIAGESIDFGPCAFMNAYDPNKVFSSIDTQGRYAFGNQPQIAHWNLSCLASALLPLFHSDKETAISIAQESLNSFPTIYRKEWLRAMRLKLGLLGEDEKDKKLVEDLMDLMQEFKMDYTNTFIAVGTDNFTNEQGMDSPGFQEWYLRWIKRAGSHGQTLEAAQEVMSAHNPQFIPRNHLVEEALENAAAGDMNLFNTLLDLLRDPYTPNKAFTNYQVTPQVEWEENYKTFCGT